VPSYDFVQEEWENQFDFCYFDQLYCQDVDTNVSAYSVSPATKAKFCFPSKDPQENLVIDKRSDSQKVTDILRIWSQLLTSDEQEIWNEIAERDLTRDISLESGIRTPKSFIENEIKAFKDLKKKDQINLLRTLDEAPNISNADNVPQQHGESLPQADLPSENPSRLLCELDIDNEFLSHFCKLSLPSAVCLSAHKAGPCNNADLPVSIAKLLEECQQEVCQIRQAAKLPLKLQLIFKSNHKLLFKYLFILSYKYNLSKSLSSVRKKLENFKTVSGKLLKKVCSALLTRKLIE
jgi:hypothetical protein